MFYLRQFLWMAKKWRNFSAIFFIVIIPQNIESKLLILILKVMGNVKICHIEIIANMLHSFTYKKYINHSHCKNVFILFYAITISWEYPIFSSWKIFKSNGKCTSTQINFLRLCQRILAFILVILNYS